MKKWVYIVVIVIICGFMGLNRGKLAVGDYAILLAASFVIGLFIKQYEHMSKDINDLDTYQNIDDIIKRFGTPYNIEEFDEYKKYTFKKSTNGWGAHKYTVDIFTLQNGKIIKHENFCE